MAPEPRSVVAWLDTVKRGYGKRYSKYFDELGVEDEEDVRRMRPARVDELREILAKANVKPVQLDYLADAIDACRENRRLVGRPPNSPEVLQRPRTAPTKKAPEASPHLFRPDTSAERALRNRRPQTAQPKKKDYGIEDRQLVSSRPGSAPAQSHSTARALIMPQPPSYWAEPSDLPSTIVGRRRRRPKSSSGGTKAVNWTQREAPGYESLKRRQQTEELGRRRRRPKSSGGGTKAVNWTQREAPGYESLKRRQQTEELGRRRRLACLGSWENDPDPRAPSDEKTCRVKRDPESGIWQLAIDPKRQEIYERIKKPVRLDGDHRAAIQNREKFRQEQAQKYKHRVKVQKDQSGLWAMDLTKDGEVNEGRQETWQRVAQPFRIRGTHVHAIATAKAEEKARRENAKKFYYDSAEGREWCDRVSQPLRAAAKFKG